jgi:PAS domain S-box-containing protein
MGTAQILVAEDEFIIGEYIQSTLVSIGYDVVAIVSSGEEAIEKAEELKPDLILMDIILSGDIDGISAAKQIIERFDIPIIYLTSHIEDETFARARESAPYGYLLKPTSEVDLYSAIEMALQRYKLEMRLKENEKRYRELVENLNDVIYSLDEKGRFTYISPIIEQLYGYSPTELMGKHFTDFIYQEDLPRLTDDFDKSIGDIHKSNEYRTLTRSGEIRWFRISERAIREGNTITGVQGVLTDITEMKKAEIELMIRDYAIASSINAICFADLEGSLTYVNSSFIKMWGYDAESEVLGRSNLSFWQREDRALEVIDTLIKDGSFVGELVGRRKDGSEFYVQISATMVMDKAGKPICMMASFVDIDEQKRADEMLRESEERMRLAVQNIPIMINAMDEGGNIIVWNTESERITGFSADHIIGNPQTWSLLYPGEKYGVKMMSKENATDGNPHNWERTLKCKDGTERTIAWSRCSKTHPIPGWVDWGIGIDITEKKLAEQERNEAYAELNQIFNTTSIGMCLIDREFNLIKTNDSFRNMFSIKSEEVVDNKCYNVWNESVCRTNICPLMIDIDANTPYKYEITKEIRGRGTIKCIVTAVPYLSVSGDTIGILESFTDITEIRRLESEVINAMETERQRIGQDLHDGLGQKLTGITFLAEVLKQTMIKRSINMHADVDDILELTRESIDLTKRLAKGLFPVAIESFGFITAISELATNIEKIFEVKCNIIRKGNFQVSDNNIASNLFYIAQESVSNAIKHGKSRNITISLIGDRSSLTLMIEDDGEGNLAADINTNGMGLRIMRYRANAIGAKFEAVGHRNGFTVSVRMKRDRHLK